MIIMKVTLIALLANLPTLALAEEAKKFRYTGDPVGIQICKAVVNDDVPKLRLALRTYKQSLANSYSCKLSGRDLPRHFTCNGMDAQEISHLVGALNFAGFFAHTGQAPGAQLAAAGR